jgi:hypothetical protein
MALKDILAISGKGGLFKFISQGRNGIIVESLSDNKRSHIPATAKISALEDIAIFTEDKEMPLQDVFKIIIEKEDKGAAIDHKSKPDELKKYMEEIIPDYDREKVYVSDIKKLLNWYNILQELDMLELVLQEDEEEKEGEEAKSEDTVEDAEIIEEDAPKSEEESSEEADAEDETKEKE